MSALDLFAGCGGASLGIVAAGVEVVAAYEFNERAARAHRALLPDCPVFVEDLNDTEPASLPDADLWWASPPCQPGSSAGKRLGMQDPRNGYPALLRLADARTPEWLIIENVPGFAQHKRSAVCSALWPKPEKCPACYLATVLHQLDELFAVVEMRALIASDYGVPQHRRRLITVCGPRRIEWPERTHGPGRRHPWASAGEALGLTTRRDMVLTVGGPAAGNGHGRYSYSLDEPSQSIRATSDVYIERRIIGAGTNPHGPDAEHERTYRDITDEPAPCVPASPAGNAGPFIVAADQAAPSVLDGTTRRTLTVRERAVLQALPWHESLTVKTVGNAVPPPLAESVVRSVITAMERGGQ